MAFVKRLFIYIFLITAMTLSLNAKDSLPYVILISFDGFRYDYDNGDTLRNFKTLEENGVSAFSLKPVFPTTTLPNHYSMITGMYADNHGIIANAFKNPFTGRQFAISTKSSHEEEFWYNGEAFWETAKRFGIKSGSCFWAASEIKNEFSSPDYSLEFDPDLSYIDRIDKSIEWLQKDEEERPHFISLYFEDADISGHTYGTESVEISYSLTILDSLLGYMFGQLKKINLFDSTNIILVSGNGMKDFGSENLINLDSLLTGEIYTSQNYGAFAMIDANESEIDNIFSKLNDSSANYKVYKKENIPLGLHFSKHPFISPLLILADPGWIFVDNYSLEKSKEIKAIHGYDNNELSMHGIFYAMGPAFKCKLKTGTLESIDIYPLLCKIFNITPRYNIDGKLDRIRFILKEE